MVKLGTSAARKDVNVNDDRIFRTNVKNETVRAKQWEKHFDFLIPNNRKELLARVHEEVCPAIVFVPDEIYNLTYCIRDKKNLVLNHTMN
jgi:hypothetical protein